MAKNLDNELAAAAGLDEDAADATETADGSMAVPQSSDGNPARGGSKPKAQYGLVAMLLVMTGGIVCLFMFGFSEAAVYSMPLQDFLGRRAELGDRQVRIEGELVPGSLVKRDRPCEYRFSLRPGKDKDGKPAADPTKQLAIRFPQCVVPDTFRDRPEGGVMVTAEGNVGEGQDHFKATQIMAKCSSKYDPETHEMEPGEGPSASNTP